MALRTAGAASYRRKKCSINTSVTGKWNLFTQASYHCHLHGYS